MYWRSFSKPVSGAVGDVAGVGDDCGAGELALGAAGVPLQAISEERIKTTTAKQIYFILKRVVQIRLKLLVANIQYRALGILINNIKPPALTRVLEEIVMLHIGENIARAETIAD